MKVCNICKEIKSIDCFGKNIALKSGINSNCKECVCLKASEWHAKNYKKKKYKKVDSLPNEIWKKYQENIYVSNFGRVKNLNFKNSDSEKLLKLYKSNKGYISTVFYINKKRTVFRVNRLVILVFKGYKKGYEVDHKNGLKHDNSLSNLRYCRQEDNKRFNNHNRIKTSKYVGVCFIKK